jgi:hypothetical protein
VPVISSISVAQLTSSVLIQGIKGDEKSSLCRFSIELFVHLVKYRLGEYLNLS